MKHKHIILLVLVTLVLMACGSAANNGGENMNHNMDMNENMDMEHADEHADTGRIPNDGAVITIVSPEDGAAFPADQDFEVVVEVEGFDLTVEGAHWHLYVDEISYGMIMNGDLNHIVRGLEPGEHTLYVYLAGPDHIELEDGDSITIVIE